MLARIERRTRESLARREHFAAILPLRTPYIPNVEDLAGRIEKVIEGSGAKVLLHPDQRKVEAALSGREDDSESFATGFARSLTESITGGREVRLPGGLRIGSGTTNTRMLFLVIDHVGVWIAAGDGEMEHRGKLAPWVNGDLWPAGVGEIGRHRAWIEICDLGFMRDRGVARLDRAFNRAAAVTAAASAVAAATDPLAVLWYPAKNALPVEAFEEQVGEVVAGRAPLAMWLRYLHIRPDEEGLNEGIVTKGLAPFCDHEIEVLPSTLGRKEARAAAFEFARLVVDSGTEPRTGMLLTPSRNHTAVVRVGESQIHKGHQVYELTVQQRTAQRA
ncbi:MAG: hypothetical protein AAF899_14980 [Pseudomonadota bacterium]